MMYLLDIIKELVILPAMTRMSYTRNMLTILDSCHVEKVV